MRVDGLADNILNDRISNNDEHLLNNGAYRLFYHGGDFSHALPAIYGFTVYRQ